MPNAVAASPCDQTAAEAASNPGMPCANRPAVIPVNTSPAPAVAKKAGAFAAIEARPPGSATTVSGPLSTTTAPISPAARRTLSSFEPTLVSGSKVWKYRENSPSCGVRIVDLSLLACMAVASRCDDLAKLVMASASSTTHRSRQDPGRQQEHSNADRQESAPIRQPHQPAGP